MGALLPPTPSQTLYELLVQGRVECALEMVGQAGRGRRLADLFVGLLEPVLYRIGADVCDDLIGPEAELAAVAFAREVVARGAAAFPRRPPHGRRVLGALAPGERHDLGLEMLLGLLAREGWTVHRPAHFGRDQVLHELATRPIDLVCLSITTPEHLPAAADLIAGVHELRGRVMVGGLAFRLVPERAVRVGADLFAEDARAALATVRATFGT